MTINSIYILSKSGGLIFQFDNNVPVIEHEKTFSYPLELKLELINRHITVVFGQRDGIKGKLDEYQIDLRSFSSSSCVLLSNIFDSALNILLSNANHLLSC